MSENSPQLIFVCTGNICRSPMAEYMMRAALPPTLAHWEIYSAGTFGLQAAPAASAALTALKEIDIDASAHLSQELSRAMVQNAACVIVATEQHREQILTWVPSAKEHVFLINSFDQQNLEIDLVDPVGQSITIFRLIRDQIQHAIPGMINHLKQLNNQSKPS